MTHHIDIERLCAMQGDVTCVRNICILAHVDHGKTTLADSLVASNGIISNKLAGKLRYLDSRPDEQLRGITMKSSSITLHHVYKEKDYVINLIDSPGHVDFSSEVSTAVRLSDGAFIIVDVVEGVCPQTRSVLSVSYIEGLKPILILNKIDRLITEMKLSPLDAYIRLSQILEQVNAVMGEIFARDVMEREDREEAVSTENAKEKNLTDWQSGLEEMDDSNLYFSPEQGNVLFASAYDGWGFGIKEFAKIYADKLGFSEKVLCKTLWGDFYINNKTKRIVKGAQEKAKKPLFVQFILDNIWVLYDTLMIRKDKSKLPHMAEKLNIKLTTRDLRLTDPRIQLQAVCSQWLPLARACTDMVCEKVPAPNNLSSEKVERLLSGNKDFRTLPHETQELKSAFLACDSSPDSPVVIFVSKMFSVDSNTLPENRPKRLTPEELAEKKALARQRHAEKMSQGFSTEQGENTQEVAMNYDDVMNKAFDEKKRNDALVAFARVYSGTIEIGDTIYVLGPKHNPQIALERAKEVDPGLLLRCLPTSFGRHISRVTIDKLYLLMGKELIAVDRVPAGNVCGIGGLEQHVLKTATLSTRLECPSFTELTSFAVPILRVALRPTYTHDLSQLIRGLKLLNQADACAVIHIQETGEVVLSTAGEVHLERCLEDLKLRYAKVDINVSKPIVPLRETIVPPPKLDMVNEAIEKKTEEVSLDAWTPSRQCYFVIDAKPLPANITKVLEENAALIKSYYNPNEYTTCYYQYEHLIDDHQFIDSPVSGKTGLEQKGIAAFKNELEAAFVEAGWKDEFDKVWSFGPHKCGLNILLNATDYEHKKIWEPGTMGTWALNDDSRAPYDNGVINGFQLATQAGPLCEESMMGVCFIVKKWQMFYLPRSEYYSQGRVHLNGEIISTFKDACKRIFSLRRPRLVTPMYSCDVLVNADVLGKLYAVFGKRQGRVISAESAHGFGGHFRVLAVLPVQESFNLASELRTQTSGLASPQLIFSHWEVIEQDPFWVPSTEEEYLHFGEKADCDNRAKRYMDAVRRRKGLPVDSQLVPHAEKQRTLSKNK